MSERPKQITQEQRMAIAEKLYRNLESVIGPIDNKPESLESLAKHLYRSIDGFDYALALQADHFDGLNAAAVQELNEAAWLYDEALRDNVMAWVIAEGIAATFAIGRLVSYERIAGTLTGEIKHYDVETAVYHIAPDGDPQALPPANLRHIVPVEGVRPV